jgi:hypothetical protein
MPSSERLAGEPVTFEKGISTYLMGIDGTWRRSCVMKMMSETRATLDVKGSIEGLNLKEFFLLLSETGLAYRRCELDWVQGEKIGVRFAAHAKAKDRSRGKAR